MKKLVLYFLFLFPVSIANADINYVGAGDTARTGKKGWYTKMLDTINPI